jgi:hypothetical protein
MDVETLNVLLLWPLAAATVVTLLAFLLDCAFPRGRREHRPRRRIQLEPTRPLEWEPRRPPRREVGTGERPQELQRTLPSPPPRHVVEVPAAQEEYDSLPKTMSMDTWCFINSAETDGSPWV